MAVPTHVGAGASASGVGSISPALPAGWQVNDIFLLVVHTGDWAVSPKPLSGWTGLTTLTESQSGIGGGSNHIFFFWRRAESGDVAPTTVDDGGDHQLGVVHAFRGCVRTGVPLVFVSSGTGGSTTVVSNVATYFLDVEAGTRLWVGSYGHNLDTSSPVATWAGGTATLVSLSELNDVATTEGVGGGLTIGAGEIDATGFGDGTITLSSASGFGHISVAFLGDTPVTATGASSFSSSISGTNVEPVTSTGASSFGFSASAAGYEGFVGIRSHLSIGSHEYLVRPGSYIKRQAPQFGARFTTGDPGLNNLSFWQHWAQRSWIGGVDQDVWSDEHMYDQGVGVDTTGENEVRLARGLTRGPGSNWDIGSATTVAVQGYRSIVYDGALYVLTRPNTTNYSWLYRYDPQVQQWTRLTSLDASQITGRCIGVFDGRLFIGGSALNTSVGKLVYSSGDLTTWATVVNPASLNETSGGAVTGVAATDIITTATAHGFQIDDQVQLATITGGVGLVVSTSYYVIPGSFTSTTFQLSATLGGAAINFTTDITAGTIAKIVVSTVTALRAFQQKLYVSYSVQVWRMDFDATWDGNTIFYRANLNSESDGIVSMATHFGFLYMLSEDGHIHRTDGSTTFDIWSWDGQTEGISIKSFDGRLFILTFEYSSDSDIGYGVLYQMSGSAVTQLKRWGDEADATRIGSMTVYDRLLFYGASNLLGFGDTNGFGLAVYDPAEDAHSIAMSNTDQVTYPPGSAPFRNYLVDDQAFFEGTAFVFVRGFGAFMTPYSVRDAEEGVRRYDVSSAGSSVAPLNGGWFTTSTYDAGTPGLLKLWRKITVDAEVLTNTSIVIEYSIDDGATWVVAATRSTPAARGLLEYWLENVKGSSFKLRFTLRSSDATVSPSLHAIQVSYVPLPEPNWLWTFTIVLSELQEGVDGVSRAVDTEAEMSYLSGLHRTKELVKYVDIDGERWTASGPGVLIYDIEFRVAQMTQPLEGEVVITLLEAVEEYV